MIEECLLIHVNLIIGNAKAGCFMPHFVKYVLFDVGSEGLCQLGCTDNGIGIRPQYWFTGNMGTVGRLPFKGAF